MAYDYNLDEMMIELGESGEDIKKTLADMYKKLEVEHYRALIRVAYEKKILLLYESVR